MPLYVKLTAKIPAEHRELGRQLKRSSLLLHRLSDIAFFGGMSVERWVGSGWWREAVQTEERDLIHSECLIL